MEKWSQDEKAFRWWSQNRDVNLLLQLVIPPSKSAMECFEGKGDPLRGIIGLHGNDSVPAPLVEFRYPSPGERAVTSAVLIAPFTGDAAPKYNTTIRTASQSSVQQLEVTLPGGGQDRIAWTNGLTLPIDDGKPFTTDATFVWTRAGSAKQFLLDGTYLRVANV
jgi:hypothetical protein